MTEISDKTSKPSRRNVVLAGVAMAGATAGVWHAGAWRTASTTPNADAAYDAIFASPMLAPAGGQLDLAALRGKLLVVNFWATWCPPCVEELPLLERFYQQRRANGWNVLAIAADSEKNVHAFLRRLPLSFTVAVAGASAIELSRSVGNLAGGLPFTLVFASDGTLAQRKLGQVQESDLMAWANVR